MVRIDRVVTRGGDGGETSLGDGARVSKASTRVAAFGTVDEANSAIGVARLHATGEADAMLGRIQNDLFDLGADPWEVRNLAGDPKHAAKLRELRALVDAWVVESGDKGDRMEDPLDVYKGYNGRLPDEQEKKAK